MNQDKLLEYSKTIRLFCRLNVNKKMNMPISPLEVELLALIYHSEDNDLTPLKISQIMNLKKPSVSAIIEVLVNNSYIEKHVKNNDKRSYVLQITKEGKKLIKDVNNIYLESIYIVEKELGEEFSNFISTMDKVNNILKNI